MYITSGRVNTEGGYDSEGFVVMGHQNAPCPLFSPLGQYETEKPQLYIWLAHRNFGAT